ncbi:hypothetical protein [uncultured Tenacibaculum sp.]|uniref:hypothetical protein n=1 Tax=uncultured Tenacibaculum sp. TaxID=174713 RepID=UPI00263A19CE|nr:hypothetical protein [uncultured Tenacibaculum sp.]
MINIKNQLLEVCYNYYPIDIDSIKDKKIYLDTNEYKRLISEINIHKVKNNEKFITELNSIAEKYSYELNDKTYFEWLDRCYTYELIRKVNDYFILVKLYKSILKPLYFIEQFKIVELDNNRVEYMDIELEEDIFFLEKLRFFCERKGFFEFDKKLKNFQVININFDDIEMGKFTFFNAFFNSQ